MNNKKSCNKTMKFRGFLVDARNIIGGFLLWGALFGFIAILPLASNAIDPQIHFCRKGEQRSVLLLDSRARQTFDSRKSIHSVSLATIEYVTAAARITMKYVQHPRVGWISKPAVEFNVTISSDATYEVTANFTDPDFSKTICLAVIDSTADDRMLESMDMRPTV